MLTQLMRTRPVVGFALALLIAVFVTFVGVGGAVTSADDSPGASVFLAFIGGMGVLMVVSFTLEAWRRSRRPFARVATSPQGEPATFLPFAPAALVGPVGLLVLVVLTGGAGAVVAQQDGQPTWVVVCGLLVVAALALLLPVLAGRVRAGGVYLTSHGIEHRRTGTSWRVAWDDVEGVLPDEPVPVVLRPGARVARTRLAPYGWNGDVHGSDDRLLGIETRHLSVDEQALAFLVASFRQHPDLRGRLGTPASVDRRMLDPGS